MHNNDDDEIEADEPNFVCDMVCYADTFKTVLDNEFLINYRYVKKDTLVDNLFSQNTVVSSGVEVSYFDGEYIRNVSYFIRFVGLYKQFVVDNDKIGYVVYLYGVCFDIKASVHIPFRISIDITAMHYNDYIVYPNILLDEIECVSLLSDIEEREEDIIECREKIKFVYSCVINSSTRGESITNIQLDFFNYSIYVPLRLISLICRYFLHRNTLINRLAINCNCSNNNNTCACICNMHYNSTLIYEMYQVCEAD